MDKKTNALQRIISDAPLPAYRK